MNEENECLPDAAVMLKLAKMRMPFGKYKERRLIDLPVKMGSSIKGQIYG